MGKYILKRLLHGAFSVVCVVLIIMVLIYSLMDRENIFGGDGNFSKMMENNRETYKQSRWKAYGYLDYVPYSDYVNELARNGEFPEEDTQAGSQGYSAPGASWQILCRTYSGG